MGPFIHRFFSINRELAPCTPASHLTIQSTTDQKQYFCSMGWEIVNVERLLYTLFYAILYEGLEHLWILVSTGGPIIPVDTKGQLKFWGSPIKCRVLTV